jgi:hypothetical protein
MKFIGIKISKQSQSDKLIRYFKQLQKLDAIVKEFSNKSFRSYVCLPYVECENPSGNSWSIEVFAAEELFWFPYPFQLSNSFLISTHKNDLQLNFLFSNYSKISFSQFSTTRISFNCFLFRMNP